MAPGAVSAPGATALSALIIAVSAMKRCRFSRAAPGAEVAAAPRVSLSTESATSAWTGPLTLDREPTASGVTGGGAEASAPSGVAGAATVVASGRFIEFSSTVPTPEVARRSSPS
nr:hypothetical protein GCM10020093_075650 [Planobispora longispora]